MDVRIVDHVRRHNYQFVDVVPTMDAHMGTGGGNVPMIVIALEGNGARPSHMGDGFSQDGVMYTLNTIEKHSVCYAIEGNVVDRISAKNGKGWCEDVSPTLNTQDKHAVCYAVYDARGNSVGGVESRQP